jgi:hypothetical protein
VHNGFGFFDREEIALSVVKSPSDGYELYAYEVYPRKWNEDGSVEEWRPEAAPGMLTLFSCQQENRHSLVQDPVAAVRQGREERAAGERDEREFQDVLLKARAVGESTQSVELATVTNQFDEGYDKIKGRRREVAGYPILAEGTISRGERTLLLRKLTERSSYFPPGEGWTCLFEPHHVLQITTSRERITVVICVHCGDVEFLVNDKSIGTHSLTSSANSEIERLLDPYTPPKHV